MRRRRFLASAVAASALATGAGLRAAANHAEPLHRVFLPGLANDQPQTATRTYELGYSFVPPRITFDEVFRTIDEIARIGEYCIIQREVPWTLVLGGVPMANIIRDEWDALVRTIRGKGMKLVVLIDPLDGLDRRREPPELVAAGRTILDGEIRAMHEEWVRLVAAAVKPEYFGLASEINTLAGHGDPVRYGVLRSMINRLAPEVRRLSPQSQVFVSFQADDAWFPEIGDGRPIDHYALVKEFDIDAVGLSSYPYFYHKSSAAIPEDYYRRFTFAAGGLPLIQVEGGWPSVPGPAGNGSPESQVAYFRKLFDLLDGVEARLCVLLTYTDLDLASPTWNVPTDRLATLDLFAHSGIVDAQFRPKPAYATWVEQYRKPLRA